jgi:4-hydroxy-3-methylbut-2-enyl diphosphate reductase
MEILIARTAGFCMGVARALRQLDEALHAYPHRPIVTLGPIIHNPQVLERYATHGVQVAADLDAIPPAAVVLIRAHGIPCDVEGHLHARGCTVVDATCPKVKKAQLLIGRHCQDPGSHLMLFGEPDHPEVRGLVSRARQATVFGSVAEVQTLLLPPGTIVLAAQTTQDRDEFQRIARTLKAQHPQITVLDTICDATKLRQEEVRTLAQKVDGILVVGGKTSGNTRRLVQLGAQSGRPTWHIETAHEIPPEVLTLKRLGVTAGASTPDWVIQEVVAALSLTTPQSAAVGP